jgi:drug/metabolite transporter (DMT)-like permease
MQFSKDSKTKALLLGVFITVCAYFFMAVTNAAVKGLNSRIPAIEIIFFQNFLCLVGVFFYNYYKKTISYKTSFFSLHMVRDIVGVLSFLFLFLAIQKFSLVEATVLSYTAPFFTPFVWALWQKEKIEKDVFWSVFIGFVGVFLILKPGTAAFFNSKHLDGFFFAILSGLLSAIALVALRKLNQQAEPLLKTLLYYFFVGTLVAIPWLIFVWKMPTLWELTLLFFIGASSLIAQILLTLAYRYGTASFLSPLSYSAVIFTFFLSAIFFHKIPDWVSLTGILLIILGGVLTFIFRQKPKDIQELLQHNNPQEKKWWQFWKK